MLTGSPGAMESHTTDECRGTDTALEITGGPNWDQFVTRPRRGCLTRWFDHHFVVFRPPRMLHCPEENTSQVTVFLGQRKEGTSSFGPDCLLGS